MTNRIRHKEPGAPTNVPRQGIGENAQITEGVPDGRTAREGAHLGRPAPTLHLIRRMRSRILIPPMKNIPTTRRPW